jgi:hypothetical protein
MISLIFYRYIVNKEDDQMKKAMLILRLILVREMFEEQLNKPNDILSVWFISYLQEILNDHTKIESNDFFSVFLF